MTTGEAVEKSKQHLGNLLPEFAEADMQLEEAEVRPLANSWKFTFTAVLPAAPGASMAQIMRGRRIAKTVEIDPDSGDLLSLKNASV